MNDTKPRISPDANMDSPLVASSLLADVFDELDRAGVQHCVLRGVEELAEIRSWQEVDLLVAPEDLDVFVQTVRRNGFAPWPAWGHAPHRFFMAFDPQDDSWLKLDVVTELRYGKPYRHLRVDMAASCLHGRARWGPTWVPSVCDELLSTTLHCVLDKGRIREGHRARLRSLWTRVDNDIRLRMRFERKAQHHIGPDGLDALADAIENDAWDSLQRRQRAWTLRLFRRAPATAVRNFLSNAILRRIRRFLFFARQHGTATVLLAPDGGGKSTLSAALARDPFLRARVIYMGGNSEAGGLRLPSSLWLERELARTRRKRGGPLVKLIRVLYRAILRPPNTLNHLIEDWMRHAVGQYHKLRGRFVVYDRYFYDTYLSPRASSLRVRLRRWVLHHTCPKPERVVMLDAPGDELYARKQEHSPELLEAQRQTLLGLANRVANFKVVDATRGADTTRRRVVWLMWNDFAARHPQSNDACEVEVPGRMSLREVA